MAHKDRKDFLPYLIERLENVRVFVDDGSLGAPENAIRCWESYDPQAKHHLVIQDDAVLTEDFLNKVKMYLRDQEVVSFYTGNRVLTKTNIKELNDFYKSDELIGVVGLAIRTDLIPEMLRYFKSLNVKGDDRRIKRFFKSKGIPVYYTKPSLVNHRTGNWSIWQNKQTGQGRQAINFK